MIAEDTRWKPGVEFYIDGLMGLCFVTTTADGRQVTGQYRRRGELAPILAQWLDENVPDEIARDALAAPDTTDCRHVDNGPSWWWRL